MRTYFLICCVIGVIILSFSCISQIEKIKLLDYQLDVFSQSLKDTQDKVDILARIASKR